jgi:hypothetical protein
VNLPPIPERMASLPRDRRGLPIPVVVARDREGLPQFAVNDSLVSRQCVARKLCPICGQRLTKELWFAGGPGSAFHPGGAYFDPAMHHECMAFALQSCPYLALPNYVSKMAAKMPVLEKQMCDELLVDPSVDPDRPLVFVAVMAFGQSVEEWGRFSHLQPLRPYHAVEFWRHGQQLSFDEGLQIVCKNREYDLAGCLRLIVNGAAK